MTFEYNGVPVDLDSTLGSLASSLFIRLICVLRVRVVSPRRGEGCVISH